MGRTHDARAGDLDEPAAPSTTGGVVSAGIHAFPDTALARYRQAVLDDAQAARLDAAARAIGCEVGGQTYKRVPAGFPANHPRAAWLRHSGLFASVTRPVAEQVFSSRLANLCFDHFARLA